MTTLMDVLEDPHLAARLHQLTTGLPVHLRDQYRAAAADTAAGMARVSALPGITSRQDEWQPGTRLPCGVRWLVQRLSDSLALPHYNLRTCKHAEPLTLIKSPRPTLWNAARPKQFACTKPGCSRKVAAPIPGDRACDRCHQDQPPTPQYPEGKFHYVSTAAGAIIATSHVCPGCYRELTTCHQKDAA